MHNENVLTHQRVQRQLFGQFVDRQLEAERPRRVAQPAHRAARFRTGEDVKSLEFEIRAFSDRLGEIADAGVEPDARRSMTLR